MIETITTFKRGKGESIIKSVVTNMHTHEMIISGQYVAYQTVSNTIIVKLTFDVSHKEKCRINKVKLLQNENRFFSNLKYMYVEK